jgi:NADPH:quinone reductase-like Zn-dependent oxidoreductase
VYDSVHQSTVEKDHIIVTRSPSTVQPSQIIHSVTMATLSLPSTMRAWQYTSTRPNLSANLHLNPVPLPTPKPTQNLVRVIAVALNPVDYKPAEIPIVGRLLVPAAATPGVDFAGLLITPASGSKLKKGQLVFGAAGANPVAGGALAEYALVESNSIVAVPEGVDPVDAATVGVAGLTAYQSIVPNVKEGDKIFINGGSGGTGVFGIQIAKAAGCHVTTTCSTVNVELCKSLGAEEVVDYKKGSVVEALKASGVKFDHVVDNIGSDPSLYWHCHEFTTEKAVYVMVGGSPSCSFVAESLKRKLIPSILGGGKRKYTGFFPERSVENVSQIAAWMKEGTVKTVIDSKFGFEEAPRAFEKLRTCRAKGKIVVDVASETYKTW